MGKKGKTGKSRKDKFYHLAKETGYRSRAAFKLLQLNRKFGFLEKARVCIDLCAAPGGWLQVASQHMGMASVIVGVDLVPIKPIHNVTTFAEDITTEKCRQTIKKELQTWKSDIVLHDGAPNVGKNWLHDAFQQATLTLQALRLATEFLRPGGWFVTKVFRSKDYHALIWVFKQLFKSVHSTKPQASRNESAEIFVVCQGYAAPSKLDPKFTDPKYVFQDVQGDKATFNVVHPEKQKKKASGYAEGDYTLHHTVKASDFIQADNHLELLADCHQIIFDDEALSSHPSTTQEIKECCSDIKVLGKKDVRNLLNWRKNIKKTLKSEETEEKEKEEENSKMEVAEVEEDEETKLDEQILNLKEQQEKDVKKKKKKILRDKKKLRDKMSLNMVIPGDHIEATDDICLFNIKKIKSKHHLQDVEEEQMLDKSASEESDDDEEQPIRKRKRMMAYDRHADEDDNVEEFYSDDEKDGQKEGGDEGKSGDSGSKSDSDAEENDLEMESDDSESSNNEDEDSDDDDDEPKEEDANPLVVEMENKLARDKRKTEMWFEKDVFAGLEGEEEEDQEIERMTEEYRKKGGVIIEKSPKKKSKEKKKKKSSLNDSENESDNEPMEIPESDSSDVEDTSNVNSKSKMNGRTSDSDESSSENDSDSDSSDSDDSDYDIASVQQTLVDRNKAKQREGSGKSKAGKDGFEIVSASSSAPKIKKLDPVGLAIGEELIKSSKRRREIEELSFNRYTFHEESLPEWFVNDESKHYKQPFVATREQVEAYKEQLKSINIRPIKKVAEAKARKKKKMVKKMERARKKAEHITDAIDVSDKEKWKQIKDVYKRAGLLKNQKEDVVYCVATKGVGKRVSRPPGVKGRFKVVDPRMKKDMRSNKNDSKRGKGAKNAKNAKKSRNTNKPNKKRGKTKGTI